MNFLELLINFYYVGIPLCLVRNFYLLFYKKKKEAEDMIENAGAMMDGQIMLALYIILAVVMSLFSWLILIKDIARGEIGGPNK